MIHEDPPSKPSGLGQDKGDAGRPAGVVPAHQGRMGKAPVGHEDSRVSQEGGGSRRLLQFPGFWSQLDLGTGVEASQQATASLGCRQIPLVRGSKAEVAGGGNRGCRGGVQQVKTADTAQQELSGWM